MNTTIVSVVILFCLFWTSIHALRVPVKAEVNTIKAKLGTWNGDMSTLPIVNEYGKRDKTSGYITLASKSNSLRTVFYFTFPKSIKKELYDLSFQLTARTKIETTQDYTWEALNITSNDWVTIDSLGSPCKRAIWCSETYTRTDLHHFLSTEKKVALRVTSDGSVALQIDHLTAFVLPKVFVVDDSYFRSKSTGTTFEFYFPSSADGASVRAVVSLPPSSSSCLASRKFSAIVLLHGSGGLWKDRRPELGLNPQFKDWRKVYNSNCWFGMYLDSFTPRGVVEQSDPDALPFNIRIAPPFIRARDALTGLYWLKKMVHTNGVDNWVHDSRIGVQGFGDGGSSAEGAVFDIDASPAGQLWNYDQTYYADDGVLAPPRADLSDGFRAAVAYYPGSEHQGYYGDPCTLPPSPDAGFFKNYAPLLIHVAKLDPLAANTACLKSTIQRLGGDLAYYRYDADHGFDDPGCSGDYRKACKLAKTRTVDYWKQYLS